MANVRAHSGEQKTKVRPSWTICDAAVTGSTRIWHTGSIGSPPACRPGVTTSKIETGARMFFRWRARF